MLRHQLIVEKPFCIIGICVCISMDEHLHRDEVFHAFPHLKELIHSRNDKGAHVLLIAIQLRLLLLQGRGHIDTMWNVTVIACFLDESFHYGMFSPVKVAKGKVVNVAIVRRAVLQAKLFPISAFRRGGEQNIFPRATRLVIKVSLQQPVSLREGMMCLVKNNELRVKLLTQQALWRERATVGKG